MSKLEFTFVIYKNCVLYPSRRFYIGIKTKNLWSINFVLIRFPSIEERFSRICSEYWRKIYNLTFIHTYIYFFIRVYPVIQRALSIVTALSSIASFVSTFSFVPESLKCEHVFLISLHCDLIKFDRLYLFYISFFFFSFFFFFIV